MKYTAKKTKVKRTNLGRLVKQVVLNMEEKKFFLVDWAQIAVAQACTIGSFVAGDAGAGGTGVIQGNTVSQRIGNKIKLHRIDVSVRITPVVSTFPQDGSVCRFFTWHNKQANGALPTAAQLFDADNFSCLRNENFVHRLSIGNDFTHSMVLTTENAGAQFSAGPEFLQLFSIYPKQSIEYSTTSGLISAIAKNDYGFGIFADGANCCVANLRSKIIYTDD